MPATWQAAFLPSLSRFLYDFYVTEGLSSLHDTSNLHRWLLKLGREVGVTFHLTFTMMTQLYKRVGLVVKTARKLWHRRQRMNFLDKSWLVQLSSKDIRSQHEAWGKPRKTSQGSRWTIQEVGKRERVFEKVTGNFEVTSDLSIWPSTKSSNRWILY